MLSLKSIVKKSAPTVVKNLMKIERNLRITRANYGKKVLGVSEGNEQIAKLLQTNKPFMVARIGATELDCIREHHFRKTYSDKTKLAMSNNAGFFPVTNEQLSRFSEEYTKHLKNVDVLGVWYNKKEDYIARRYCVNASMVPLRSIEPYYHTKPWSKHLEGKKVLVIHPFSHSIADQYNNQREKLFQDLEVLPVFEIKTFQAVQSIANNETPYNSWFDALEYMNQEIKKIDFDVAIIGAGAYGLPLASLIKEMGKQAIHLGGATQILFGIKGHRWDNHPVISFFYNEHWVRPSGNDIPKNYQNVENGCYW